jgi:TPR repeat protein
METGLPLWLRFAGPLWFACCTSAWPAQGLPGGSLESLSHLKQRADTGDADALTRLGIVYHNGDGVRPDLKAAAHCFQLAAATGDRAAQYELGTMYRLGEGGLPRDDRRAIDLYTRSARQDFEPANLALGVDYELGEGIPRSRSQAIRYLQRAGADGTFLADALASGTSPARFDGALALGNYLTQLARSPVAAGWTHSTSERRAGEPPTLGALLNSRRHPAATPVR